MNDKPRGRGRGRARVHNKDSPNVGGQSNYSPRQSAPAQHLSGSQKHNGPGQSAPAWQHSGGQKHYSPGQSSPVQHLSGPRNEKSFPVEAKGLCSHDSNASQQPVSDVRVSPRSNKRVNFTPNPGYGSAGHPISLIANYFALKCNHSKVYHYFVNIYCIKGRKENLRTGSKGPRERENKDSRSSNIEKQQKSMATRKEHQEVFSQLLSSRDIRDFKIQQYAPIYDGSNNIFTSSPLPSALISLLDEFPFTARVNDRDRNYVVCLQSVKKGDGTNIIHLDAVLKNVKKNNLNDVTSDVILALNAIMNHRAPESLEIRVGRSFFSVSQASKRSIGEGLEIWKGYTQTIHLTDDGPVMVSNLSAKLFHKAGPIIDSINEILGQNRDIRREGRLSEYDIIQISQALKGVKVYATHSKFRRKYNISDEQTVSREPANELVIIIDEKKITVADYYRSRYTALKYPHLHCFKMRTTTNTYIPFENCEIVENQPRSSRYDFDGNLPPKLASKMIRETAVRPLERFQQIQNHVNNVTNECRQQMSTFGLQLNRAPIEVEARVISPPVIGYTSNGPPNKFFQSRPNECGTWAMKGKFIKALRVDSWKVLNFDRRCPFKSLKFFSDKLISAAGSCGLLLDKNVDIVVNSQMNSLCEAKNSGLVVIVLPWDNKYLYNELKLKADCELGLVSQCVLSDAVNKCDNRTLTNICLKINVKLGGINHQLQSDTLHVGLSIFFPKPMIVFGADVVHSINFPSIASVVGSLDGFPSKYKMCCQLQENSKSERGSQELIVNLQNMVEIILREFQKNTEGKYPERIIFFRDGVSEGQFREVFKTEIPAIQRAAKKVFGFVIDITFIVVQKRHQTRFKPKNPREGVGREGNIPAGTVVDRHLTYPNAFDFFLGSHEGIKGTTKPARYTVLYDDCGFSADQMQSFAYHLCHTFARCNRSVSIPAPVKYADLAAYRAKKYVDMDFFNWKKKHPKMKYEMSRSVINAINNMHENKHQMFFI